MPNRILKDSICESFGLSACSVFARELFSRLITYADDYGRFDADTQIMLARLYPREMDCVTQADIMDALTELCGVGKIVFYTSEPRKTIYGCFPNWKSHQRVRESRKKCPDPDDTTVNEWYLQRFIPMDLKVEIIERDNFKCQICGKFITSDRDAKRLAKHGCGMYHMDHVVPVSQGGRATKETLRLTCPTCNLKRRERFSVHEILRISRSPVALPNVAAICGKLPQAAADRGLNPIQSESESQSISQSESNTRERADKPPARPRFTPPTLEEVRAYCQEAGYPGVDAGRFVSYYQSNGWKVGKNPMRDWQAAVRSWNSRETPSCGTGGHGGYESGLDRLARLYEEEFGGK